MTQSKLKWWILLQLLLVDQALCRTPLPPPPPRTPPLPAAPPAPEEGHTARQNQPPGAAPPPPPPPTTTTEETVPSSRREDRLLAVLGAKLRGTPLWRGDGGVRPNASCEELLAASSPSPALFLRELLGLALVPVLVASGCPAEARLLVLRLYELLGADDTDQLLMELEGLMERRGPPRGPASSEGSAQEGPHLQAVMFNIRQLAGAGEGEGERRGGRRWGGQRADRCEGWTRVNGTLLLGEEAAAVGAGAGAGRGGLEEAVRACESLGARCAGVSRGDDVGGGGGLDPGLYRAVMKTPGSRAVPSERADSECWIRQCREEEDDDGMAFSGRGRGRRSPQTACVDEQEKRVYGVVEWLPGVSTFYNLGTAVYYAAVNCSDTAKERALMSAVDLGTDALMAVTGGAAGVAGYALGAGFKTGVKAGIKYMMNTMRQEEDVMVNQLNSWEDGVIDVQ